MKTLFLIFKAQFRISTILYSKEDVFKMETCKVAAIATQVFKTFAIIKKCYEIEGKQTIKDHQQLINLIKQQYSVGHVADASQLFREGDVGG